MFLFARLIVSKSFCVCVAVRFCDGGTENINTITTRIIIHHMARNPSLYSRDGLLRLLDISNTLRLEQYDHQLAHIVRYIFWEENNCILMQISLNFWVQSMIDNKSSFDQAMAWQWTGNNPLCEPVIIESDVRIDLYERINRSIVIQYLFSYLGHQSIQGMACYLTSTITLPEPVLNYWQWDP